MAQAQNNTPAGIPQPAPAPPVRSTGEAFTPPAPTPDPDALGRGVQRTMRLLEGNSSARRSPVRILFYGQSITEQDWWKQVADDLRRRYPYADLDIRNRAIGGFASQRLVRPAEHDVYPFYPDLVIFHVYGANQQYEEIIRAIRSRTTAEVLIQMDHLTRIVPKADRTPDKDKGAWWDDFMNHTFLPETARKYGCGLVDVRGGWEAYLRDNHLEPKALLSDDVHLNAHGNFLMAELIKRYLVYRPDLDATIDKDAVKTFTLGTDLTAYKGKIAFPFTGNRVEAVWGTSPGLKSPARVRIDGKEPSEWHLFQITRPDPGPWSPLFLSRVDRGDTPLQAETWTLTVKNVSADSTRWEYDLSGSRTGPDGSGRSDAPFVSPSGRVRIAPESFFHPDGKTIAPGYKITWYVLPLFRDLLIPPVTTPADVGKELSTVIAQGLPNGPHTLEITFEGVVPPPVRAIRIYKPPVAAP